MGCVPTDRQPTADRLVDHTPLAPPTRADARQAAATQYRYLVGMELLERDARLLAGVARFGSMTTAQIATLYFYGLKSDTSYVRRLKHLTEAGMLSRVAVRLPGGSRGGSPMGCYQIGPTGWKSYYTTRFRPIRDQTKLLHTLKVVDVYISLKETERAGYLDILSYNIEFDAWVNVAGAEIHPDMYLELGLRHKRQKVSLWIEVDRDTEWDKKINDKIQRYKYAKLHDDEYPLEVFPDVLFLATDEDRVKELRGIVRRSNAPDGLVSAEHVDSFPQCLL